MLPNSDLIFQLGGVPVDVASAGGKVFYYDPTNGNDNYAGTSAKAAKKTLLAGYNLLRDGYNDILVAIGGATADTPAVAFVWSKNYAHLIGANNGLPGMGQRSRIVNAAAYNLATLIEFSGSGCLIANTQFFDGKNSAVAGQNVLVSGSRNHFVNCFFAGMGDATAGAPATIAGSYSLKVTGSENAFEESVIGLDTVVRSAANHELIVAGGARNLFRKCQLRSWSVTAGKFLVGIDSTSADMRDVVFEDSLFFNYSPNWATGISNAIDTSTITNTAWVILKGENLFVGNGMGIATDVSHVYGAGAAPNAGMFIATQPTT